MHDKRLYGTATVGTKGQVVIPADAREQLGIQPGDRLYVLGSPSKGVCALLKEELLEEHMNRLSDQLEAFKSAKEEKEG